MALFERHEFLELFDSEKIKNIDEHIDDVSYFITVHDNLIFKFHTITCEEHSCIGLYYKNISKPLFDIELKNLKKISVKEGALLFYKKESREKTYENQTQEPFLTIQIKPHFNLEYTI